MPQTSNSRYLMMMKHLSLNETIEHKNVGDYYYPSEYKMNCLNTIYLNISHSMMYNCIYRYLAICIE